MFSLKPEASLFEAFFGLKLGITLLCQPQFESAIVLTGGLNVDG